MLDRLGLDWKANKTDLIELGYAFKVANCFGTKLSAKDIIGRLARIFKVDMTESYIYKKYSEMRMRGRNSRTYFMDTLIDGLNIEPVRQVNHKCGGRRTTVCHWARKRLKQRIGKSSFTIQQLAELALIYNAY